MHSQKMEHKTNLETNKHYMFDFCRIERDNTVVCWNVCESLDSWLINNALFIVEIWIDELGLLHIESNPHEFFLKLGLSHIESKKRNANYILSNYKLNIR